MNSLYTQEDRRRAARLARKWSLILGGAELVLLAAYGAGIALGWRWAMLAALLLAFVAALFLGDLCLLPALRYRKFLRELDKGLRRRTVCTVESLKEEAGMQDGARVRELKVRLDDGDSRIFYVNADHADQIPEPGAEIELESCGRHVTGVRRCEEAQP